MDRWRRMQDLFEATVGLDPATRARVLRERAAGDEELSRQVEALARADGAELGGLDGTAAELLLELRDEPPAEELCGATFGPYRVDAHLSSGGMGHVYAATRTSAGTERRVALKVLRPGLDTAAFLERFQVERETLARLEHEHIVAFLDALALPDGRPCLVMEFVDGVPLTCWRPAAALREKLELFLQVLAAVQYAHENLVVHRDLKPENVLVTAGGTPKLLDFGVVALLAAEEPTPAALAPLTPAYASPEQLRGEAVTTASDVYSLGALLHELVLGAGLRLTPEGAEVAATGDLGAILRKATATERAQRYGAVEPFAGDLRRYLAGEPVSARGDGWTYRARLFARRRRWPIALAGAVLVALVAGWIGSDLDRRRAEREASLGWGAHGQAKAVVRVLEEWVLSATSEDDALRAQAAGHLERALAERLSDDPEAETLLRMTLVELYLDQGLIEPATRHAERALLLANTTRGVGRHDRERAARLEREVQRARRPR